MKNILLGLLLFSGCAFAQEKAAADSVLVRNTLGEVIITSTPIQDKLQRIPAAVNVIAAEDFQRGDQLSIANELNKNPGIQMQQGALNTSRISIRGLGARSQYSTNRVKAYIEGIPLTTGEGETTLEDIDLNLIQRMEIIKGPASSSYGAGLGGAINISVIKPERSTIKLNGLAGAYGLLKSGITAALADDKTAGFVSFNHLEKDGFRANSNYNRNTLTGFARTQINAASTLTFFGNYTRVKAFIPSSVNEETLQNSPEDAAFTWGQAQGYESYDKALAGLSYEWNISTNHTWQTSVFANYRDAYEPRPFDILDEDSFAFGIRSTLKSQFSLFNLPAKSSIGVEYFDEHYQAQLFNNLYEENDGNGSLQGDRFSNQEQDRKYLNLFAQLSLQLAPKLKADVGLNYNHSRYRLDDYLNEANIDNSGVYTYPRIFLPQAGLSYEAASDKFIYASVSRGFSLPTVAETLTPEGAINPEIKSETGMNYELGLKAQWLDKKLYTELALYTVQVTNLLVAERVGDDQYVGRNAGATDHNGIEFFIHYRGKLSPEWSLQPYGSLAINDYSFDEFVDNDANYNGNDLTGVADQVINLGLDVAFQNRFKININYRHTGSIPLNDDNSLYSDAYNLVNLRGDYSFTLFNHVKTQLFAGVNNVFDTNYAAQVLPNATGFGGAAPRYYYPGEPVNFYAGLNIDLF